MTEEANDRYPPEKWYNRAVAKTPDWSPLDEDTPALDVRLPHGAKLCTFGVVLPETLTFEQWLAVGKVLVTMGKSALWGLAEWWADGRHRYGERARAAENLPYSFRYLCNLGWVARSVPSSSRNEHLDFTHHMKVAKLGHNEQEYWLNKAAEENWSVETLKQEIRKEAKAKRQEHEREAEQEDPDAYRIKKSCEKAAEAVCEFEKIAKGGGGHWRLDHSIDDIIAADPYLKDLPDEVIAKLIKAAISVIDRFRGVIGVLEKHQEQRAKPRGDDFDEPSEAERKPVERERLDDEDEAEEDTPKKKRERERLDQRDRRKPVNREIGKKPVKQKHKKKAA
jgi:hypothetical protein